MFFCFLFFVAARVALPTSIQVASHTPHTQAPTQLASHAVIRPSQSCAVEFRVGFVPFLISWEDTATRDLPIPGCSYVHTFFWGCGVRVQSSRVAGLVNSLLDLQLVAMHKHYQRTNSIKTMTMPNPSWITQVRLGCPGLLRRPTDHHCVSMSEIQTVAAALPRCRQKRCWQRCIKSPSAVTCMAAHTAACDGHPARQLTEEPRRWLGMSTSVTGQGTASHGAGRPCEVSLSNAGQGLAPGAEDAEKAVIVRWEL